MESNLINITDAFKGIADSHKQIHSYGFGELANINTSGTIDYVMMWVEPNGSVVKHGEVGLSFRILIMDILKKDVSNLEDILNDTHLICLDVLAKLYQQGIDAVNGAYKFHLKAAPNVDEVVLTDFIDRFDEEVAGWAMEITLWINWNWDECSIPD